MRRTCGTVYAVYTHLLRVQVVAGEGHEAWRLALAAQGLQHGVPAGDPLQQGGAGRGQHIILVRLNTKPNRTLSQMGLVSSG